VHLDDWNETILSWFFDRRPLERVYLRVDDGELERLNADRGLGLAHPAKDLIAAVQDEVQGNPSLGWLRRQGDEWHLRADPDEAPPWLAVLAVSVLVVSRESEHGSLAFYQPLSEALGVSTILTREDYEEAFFKWWLNLATWLTDSAGKRGLPSWRRIPLTGPRCVVGHPYTQVLLRREDFRDLDAFLVSLGQLRSGDLEITDTAGAGADLLGRLRRWAGQRTVSSRLWEILYGSHREASDTLQYMLLDRLLDEVNDTGARLLEREAKLVVSLDDWTDRRLRFSAVAPSSVERWGSRTLQIDGHMVGPLNAGEPHTTPIPVDGSALSAGVSVTTQDDIALVYRPSDIVVLAVRDWSIWCSVDDAEDGETVYLLVSDRARPRLHPLLDSFAPSSIGEVPEGWRLYGPSTLTLPSELDSTVLPMRRRGQAVPRLVGGLEVARRSYLVGGPPAVFIPGDGAETVLRLDGTLLDPEGRQDADSLVDLRPLQLGQGSHLVDVGPYRLTFELHVFEQLPTPSEVVGRTTLGATVPSDRAASEAIFAGATRLPAADYDPVVICPVGPRMVALGTPGSAAECSAMMASWAVTVGVPQLVFEPTQRSSYVDGQRPLDPLLWMAVLDEVTTAWSVTQVRAASTPERTEQMAAPHARDFVLSIGDSPSILIDGRPEHSPEVAQRWRTYADSVLGAP
jgi:hypothetical protein